MCRKIALLVCVIALGLARTAESATWYVGNFNGSTPSDDLDCGAGKGASPAAHPCASLAYWTGTRRNVLQAGDVVRLTGTFGPLNDRNHCIVPRPNVTYEGRTTADAPAAGFDDAVVDAASTPNDAPCHGGAINCRSDAYCAGFGGFTLRYLTLANAPGVNGEGNQLIPASTVSSDLVIDHVRFTHSASNGLLIGSGASNEDDPCDGVRNVRNITIADSQFDQNTLHDSQAGLWLTCTDGGSLLRSSAFDNRGDGTTQAECMEDDDQPGCEGHRGYQFGGWINGLMADCVAHDNGYYNVNFSGNSDAAQCDALTHDIIVERLVTYDPGSSDLSYSHCNYNITVQNSFAWGHGTAINQYSCAHDLHFYNNTFWTDRGMLLFTNCRACDFRNNIFRCNSASECLYVDRATRNPLTTWEHNVVVNAGSGVALKVSDSNGECVGTPGGSCDCPGTTLAVCPNSDPQSPGCPSPWKDNLSPTFGNSDLDAFQLDAMFGAETGVGDTWGFTPAVVDPSTPEVGALHLAPTDTVARNTGTEIEAALFGPAIDADGDARPQEGSWDIGADEVAPTDTPTSAPSGTPIATLTPAASTPPTVTPTPAASDTPIVTSSPASGTPIASPTQLPTATATPFGCAPMPESGCRRPTVAGKSEILFVNAPRAAHDLLHWVWRKGAATSKTDFGSPATTTSYVICVYQRVNAAASLISSTIVPPAGSCGGHPCWKSTRHGFTFASRNRFPGGKLAVALHEGGNGAATITFHAQGSTVAMPALPMPSDAAVVVQITNGLGVCWESDHAAPALKNDEKRFHDRSD
jgi:hypothetical protein